MKSNFWYLFVSFVIFNFSMGSPLYPRNGSIESSILSPTEGSVYSNGDNVSIVWMSTDNTLCSINLIENNTAVSVAQNVESNQGQYLWTIPQNLSDSTEGLKYNIQIIYNDVRLTSGNFTIKKGCSSDSSKENSVNIDPMSGAKASASITIIGSENQQQQSLAIANLPSSYILGVFSSIALMMVTFF